MNVSWDAVRRYSIAIGSVAAGLLIRIALIIPLGPSVPYITLFPAVLFAAWFGGLGPGIFSAVLSLIAAFYFVIPPFHRLGPTTAKDAAGAAVFLAVSVFISLLNESLTKTRARSLQRLRDVETESSRRGQAEIELAEARREAERARDVFRTTLASIGDGVIALDLTGRVTFVNAVAEDLTGWTGSAAIGKLLPEVFVIRDEKTGMPVESPVHRAIRHGTVVSLAVHTVLITRDGLRIPIEHSAAPIKDENQSVLGAVLVFRDVTSRRRSEEAIRRSEERLKLALDAGQIGVWDWDIVRNRLEWSDLIYPIEGIENGKFAGAIEDFIQLVHPDDRERITQAMADALKGAPYDVEFRVTHTDGTIGWVSTTASVLINDTGEPSRMLGATTDITARKLPETHRLQQWHIFDTALSNSQDFVYVFNLEGRFTYVNRALLTLWQRSLEDSVGKNFFDLGYPDDLAARLQSQIQQVIDTKQPLRDQTPFTGPTGETGFYEYIFVPVLAANGRVEAVAGTTRDVTERAKGAELVERDRRRWRDLLYQAPAAIMVLRGPEHTFEWANQEYLRMVARSAPEIIGRTVRDAIPEVGGEKYFTLIDKVFRTGEPFVGHEEHMRLDRGDGVLKDVYLNFVYLPTKNDEGKVDGVFVHATDVTDLVVGRKMVEASEHRYRALTECIPQLIWTATPDGMVDYVSSQSLAYYQVRAEELLGSGWMNFLHPDDRGAVAERWRRSISTGVSYEMAERLIRGSDATYRWHLVRAFPLTEETGRVIQWFGTSTDIENQKTTEAALTRANSELEEFAYVASHDLQEPLRMVNIYTQLILREMEAAVRGEDQALQQYGSFVHQGVKRMEVLIQDLLTFSRAVHTDELPIGTTDLSSALAEAVAVLKDRIDETGAVVSADDPLPTVRGDGPQMAHVFQNLLSNSLKYRRKDIPLEIRITARREGSDWIIAVGDNGIGFEPQYADRIFGLFKRLHQEAYPGTGLGLAICKRILERFGGRIWAVSSPGEGATFYFSLPPAN